MSPDAKDLSSHMSNDDLHWIANYIWGIADDVLRDLYVRGKYGVIARFVRRITLRVAVGGERYARILAG